MMWLPESQIFSCFPDQAIFDIFQKSLLMHQNRVHMNKEFKSVHKTERKKTKLSRQVNLDQTKKGTTPLGCTQNY